MFGLSAAVVTVAIATPPCQRLPMPASVGGARSLSAPGLRAGSELHMVHCWAIGTQWVVQLASAATAGAGGWCGDELATSAARIDVMASAAVRRGACELQPELGCERWAAPAAAPRPRGGTRWAAQRARGRGAGRMGDWGRVRCVQVSWAEKRQARAWQALQGLHPLVPPKVPGPSQIFFFFSPRKEKKNSARPPYPFPL